MYAIIEDGPHQYRVEEGARLDVQLHDLDEAQASIEFDKVLLVCDGDNTRIGQPYLTGAKVSATIEGEVKGDKITTYKFRRRKNYRRKLGHRQHYLRVRIDKISA